MRTTILVDNQAEDGLSCEWGFSALIEANGVRILLDAGASDMFASNARDLGIDLSTVDYAVLSHAHFDHADGFDEFLDTNKKAPLLIQNACGELCWSDAKGDMAYIGVKRGLLDAYAGRIERIDANRQFAPGCWLLGHCTKGLDAIGAREHLYLKTPDGIANDDFAHEQSLVIETSAGLVIFNSCSHSGIDVIIREVRDAFADKPIMALVGGLHLFMQSDEQVLALADTIRKLGIKKIYTGHCTGERALELLESELGDVIERTCAGKVFEL